MWTQASWMITKVAWGVTIGEGRFFQCTEVPLFFQHSEAVLSSMFQLAIFFIASV